MEFDDVPADVVAEFSDALDKEADEWLAAMLKEFGDKPDDDDEGRSITDG